MFPAARPLPVRGLPRVRLHVDLAIPARLAAVSGTA